MSVLGITVLHSSAYVADWRSFAFTGKIFISLHVLRPARNASRNFVFRRRVSSSGRYISFHAYWTFGRSAADSVSHDRVVDSTGLKAIGRTVTNVRLSSADDFCLAKRMNRPS